MIAVGLVPKLYDLDHQPGWLQHSVAFHADDGKYVPPLRPRASCCPSCRPPVMQELRVSGWVLARFYPPIVLTVTLFLMIVFVPA